MLVSSEGSFLALSLTMIAGTDHQRIAKLDRENEVAPPPKVAPSVGRVRFHFAIIPREYPLLTRTSLFAGHANRPPRPEALAEGYCAEG